VRILVVEDEPKLARAVSQGLEADGYSVTVASTGEDGFFLLCCEPFDLAILDVRLPGRDGFEILGAARRQGLAIPALLLTSKDAIDDRPPGLDIGADDYLAKPFAFPDLLARIRALVPGGAAEPPSRQKLADLEIDLALRSVTRKGQAIELTATEYDLFAYLFSNVGHIVSREMIAREIWKDVARQTPLDNVIDVHLAHLRRKIDGPYEKKLIHNVRGLGFVLREGDADSE
jgi:two-component system, OmpR family, copper resistance phosphate regulon response regulator CusR